MATYTLLTQMNTPSGAVSQSTSATADAIIEMDVEIPLANDTEVALACEYGQMKGVYLLASKAMTLEVNSGSAPDQTISLLANVPKAWIYGGDGTNPFSEDITALFVSAAAAGTLKIRILTDATP